MRIRNDLITYLSQDAIDANTSENKCNSISIVCIVIGEMFTQRFQFMFLNKSIRKWLTFLTIVKFEW